MLRQTLLAGSFALSGAVAAPPVADVSPMERPAAQKPAPVSPADEAHRDALTRYGVGLIRARHDQIATAARQFEAAVRKDPTAAAPQRELAKLYAELGREPAAAAAGEKALTADPNDLATARLVGRIYADARRWPEAVRVFKLAAASKELTDPVSKLLVLKDLARTADAAADPAAATARTDALAVLKEHRVKFLHPEVFTAAELERERVRLYEGLGTALMRKGDFAAAVAAFEAARDLAADPKAANDPAAVARLHWNLSGVRSAEGDPANALTELEKYLAFRPAAFEPYERFVQLMKRLKRDDELPGRLGTLADANPKNLAPQWLAAAETLARRPTAHDSFRRLAEKGTTADEYRVLATAYRDADKPKELLDLLDRAYKAVRPDGGEEPSPDQKVNPDAVTRSRLFTQAVRQLRPPFTAALLTQASTDLIVGVARHTDTLDLLYGLAERDGELAAAASVLEKSILKRPKDVRLKGLTVDAYARLRDWDSIIQRCEQWSRADAGRFYPHIVAQAAIAHAELGRKPEAIRALNHPDLGSTPNIQRLRVTVLNMLGDHAAALKECDAALENDKLTPIEQRSLLVARATTLNHRGKHAEAETIWRELLDADPDDVLVLNNLGYELADQNRKLEEAEALLRRAVELSRWERARSGDPDAENGGYLDSLGWALFRRGKLKESRELLEKAVGLPESAADAIVWDHLGDVAFRQGEKKRAGEAWRKAAELYRGSHTGREKGRLDEVKRKLLLAE
ncbi:MAG: tetratricopeptide repeat protein [Fimbriiglobus sp.]|nr:tetratricopeptide repeat protein [Fimbriiglobus sp.]